MTLGFDNLRSDFMFPKQEYDVFDRYYTRPFEAVPSGAVDIGAKKAEEAIESQLGVSIKLPRKLTAKEIERMVGSLLPSDVEDAINASLMAASQAVSSALTSLATSAGIGSIVPGLGTLVGIGVALVAPALKKFFSKLLKKPPQPYEKKCKTKWDCPKPPELSTLVLLPWAMQQMVPLNAALAKERANRYCGKGKIVTCNAWLSTLAAEAFRVSKNTPQVLGLGQVNRLIGLYESTPKHIDWYDTKKHRIVKITPRAASDINTLLNGFRKRKAELDTFVAEANTIPQMRASKLAQLRFKLVTEMRNAAVQVQFNPVPETVQWFKSLAQYLTRLTEREQQLAAARAAESKRQEEVLKKATSEQLSKHQIDTLRFRCGDGHQPSCEELRKLQGGAPQGGARRPATPQQWMAWLRGARSDQLAKRPVRQPPPIPPRNPPGLPGAWVVWLNRARMAQKAGRPVKFPPAIPAAWVR